MDILYCMIVMIVLLVRDGIVERFIDINVFVSELVNNVVMLVLDICWYFWREIDERGVILSFSKDRLELFIL